MMEKHFSKQRNHGRWEMGWVFKNKMKRYLLFLFGAQHTLRLERVFPGILYSLVSSILCSDTNIPLCAAVRC